MKSKMNNTMNAFMAKQNEEMHTLSCIMAQATKEEVQMIMEVCFNKLLEKMMLMMMLMMILMMMLMLVLVVVLMLLQ